MKVLTERHKPSDFFELIYLEFLEFLCRLSFIYYIKRNIKSNHTQQSSSSFSSDDQIPIEEQTYEFLEKLYEYKISHDELLPAEHKEQNLIWKRE